MPKLSSGNFSTKRSAFKFVWISESSQQRQTVYIRGLHVEHICAESRAAIRCANDARNAHLEVQGQVLREL